MRLTSVLSILFAVLLAAAAAFMARNYIDQQLASNVTAPQQQAAEPAAPQRTIVVATQRMGFGTLIEAAALEEIPWASDRLPAGTFETIDDVIIGQDEDQRRFAIATIEAGEPVFASKITAPGERAKLSTALTPGLRAMSIRVNDVLGVAGFVLPGDRVDVLLTRRDHGDTIVDVLLQGVRVLAIDQMADERRDDARVVRTVTFEVSTEQAQKLTLGSTVGTLSLALRNFATADEEDTRRVTVADLGITSVSETLDGGFSLSAPGETDLALAGMGMFMMEGTDEDVAMLEAQDEVLYEDTTPEARARSIVGVIRNLNRTEYTMP